MQHAADEAAVRKVLDQESAALLVRDAEAALALLADDVVMFDLAPPLQAEQPLSRDEMQTWFRTWKTGIAMKHEQLKVLLSGDLALAHSFQNMRGTKVDGEEIDLWFRSTIGLRRDAGTWKIIHVHTSVPFKMDGSNQAALDLKPR